MDFQKMKTTIKDSLSTVKLVFVTLYEVVFENPLPMLLILWILFAGAIIQFFLY